MLRTKFNMKKVDWVDLKMSQNEFLELHSSNSGNFLKVLANKNFLNI